MVANRLSTQVNVLGAKGLCGLRSREKVDLDSIVACIKPLISAIHIERIYVANKTCRLRAIATYIVV